MSSEPSFNGNNTSPVQRLLIAAGALIVVALTVIAAVLLAVQPSGQDKVTPVASVSPVTGAPTSTAIVIVTPTASATSLLLSPTLVRPSATTAIIEPVETPSDTPTPIPPTATNTAVALPPTATSTPIVVIVTPTPLPTTVPEPAGTLGVCQPPANWFAYTVQSGDTLNSLSTRTGVSVFDLQQVNCLATFTIQPGQVIYLPFNPPTPTVTNTPPPVTPTPTPSRTDTPTPIPRPPEIFSINISIARDTIIIGGRGFEPDKIGFRVQLTGSVGTVALELGDLRSSTGFEAKIPADLPGGDYDLRIINPDDQFVIRRVTLPPAP